MPLFFRIKNRNHCLAGIGLRSMLHGYYSFPYYLPANVFPGYFYHATGITIVLYSISKRNTPWKVFSLRGFAQCIFPPNRCLERKPLLSLCLPFGSRYLTFGIPDPSFPCEPWRNVFVKAFLAADQYWPKVCVCRRSREVYSENTSPRQLPLESTRSILLNTLSVSEAIPRVGAWISPVVFWHHWLGSGDGLGLFVLLPPTTTSSFLAI